jgi:hypothetical protein
MKDIVVLLTVFAIGYIAFVIVVIFLGKLIFPFLTKEELERRNTIIGLKSKA